MDAQCKDLMVVEVRIGIPVRGFTALGQVRLLESYMEKLRELNDKDKIIAVIDRVELG